MIFPQEQTLIFTSIEPLLIDRSKETIEKIYYVIVISFFLHVPLILLGFFKACFCYFYQSFIFHQMIALQIL